jgi:hypothetical protein
MPPKQQRLTRSRAARPLARIIHQKLVGADQAVEIV